MDTILYLRKDNSVYLKNIFTESICEISSLDFDSYENKNELIKSIDTTLPFISEKNDGNADTLGVFVVCTMGCNLTCSYCFENGKDRSIAVNDNNKEKVYSLIVEKFKKGGYKRLDLTFTGGEPLLNFSFIEWLSNKLKESLPPSSIDFLLITNGTIISKKIISFLAANDFTIQISFDGSMKSHNSERKNRLGKGTYSRIINNLDTFFKNYPLTKIRIRVNINNKNIDDIESLFVDLSPYNKFPNFSLYFDFVAVPSSSNLYVNSENKKNIYTDLLSLMKTYGFTLPTELQNGGKCMYKNNHGFTIHADGEIYKCYSLVGEKNHSIKDYTVNYEWEIQTLCFDKSCPYYEFCYGGCPYNEFVLHGKMSRDCQFDYLDFVNRLLFLIQIGIPINLAFNLTEDVHILTVQEDSNV